jgi:hypothetical protein
METNISKKTTKNTDRQKNSNIQRKFSTNPPTNDPAAAISARFYLF